MALTDSLISYWKLDEASGNAIDAHGANDLTDNNTVGATTGKINNGRDFELSSSEFLALGDNDALSVTGDFTFAAWVNLESKGSLETILAKYNGDLNLEYALYYYNVPDRFIFQVASANGFTNLTTVTADNLGSPSTSTWYYVVAWHDGTADTLNIQVNNGTVNSTAYTHGPYDGAASFEIGNNAGGAYFDGIVDEVGFWKRILTSQERTALYNGGSGLSYDDFDAGGGTIVPILNHHRRLMEAA